MNTEIISKATSKIIQSKSLPKVKVGQTVQVDTVISEGGKTRVQKFIGLVIAVKGEGVNKTFTVRKISNGYGVEKIFPLYSLTVRGIAILREEPVRRSKLYFMRDRSGRSALRVKKGKSKIFDDMNSASVDEVLGSDEESVVELDNDRNMAGKAEATHNPDS